jgi:hypothetical protein
MGGRDALPPRKFAEDRSFTLRYLKMPFSGVLF